MNRKKKRRTVPLVILIVLLVILDISAALYIYHLHTAGAGDAGSAGEGQEAVTESISRIGTDTEETGADFNASSHVYSHRGSGEGVEEHSFAGYDKAIADGSRFIEQDIVTSADGTLYVSHDETAERLTGTDRKFSAMSDDEIDALTTYGGNHILRLSEVFDRYADQKSVRFVIELKSTDSRAADSFISLVKEYGNQDRIIVQCFELGTLERLEDVFPDMPKLYLCESQADIRAGIGAPYVDIISVKKTLMSESNCEAVHESGRQFSVWTLDSEDEIRRAIEIGADSYFTNDTPLALRLEKEVRAGTEGTADDN